MGSVAPTGTLVSVVRCPGSRAMRTLVLGSAPTGEFAKAFDRIGAAR
jgi:hypothetical protein